MSTDIQELYSEACELHKTKNYDAVFKILDEIKRLDPTFKRAYYLESWTWECLGNSVNKVNALEKILPLLDFSSPEEKEFADEIVKRLDNAGREFYNEKNYNAALKIAKELEEFNPNYRAAYYLEERTWERLDNPVKRYYALEKLLPMLEFSPPEEKDFAVDVLTHVGDTLTRLGFPREAKNFYMLIIETVPPPKNVYAVGYTIFRENSLEDSSIDSFHALYNEYRKSLAGIKPYPRKFYNHEKIRVGFISGDFHKHHPAINWSWSLLTKLDKNFFATYFYSNSKLSDEVTEQLRATADGWREIFDLTDEQAAKLIRDDEIDILFDLSGHTNANRLHVAVYHPASVQLSGIGHVSSTGLHCFEYFLSDETCAGDENYFTEKLIKLPHSHFCHRPLTKLEPASLPPCMKNKFVTFGSFNQIYKITDSMLRAWKKILDAVPDSHLLLKNGLFNTDDGKNFVSERLKSFGFDLSRVELRGISSDWLAQYADMDIALDTFPYTGGVTTCEALYMGVPVISLYGDRHGSRFGLSMLKNIGLEELAVNSYDDYIARAVMLAGDWELLALLRKNLRTMMKKSPLMNSELYLREIQTAFRKILNEQKNIWGKENVDGHSRTLFGSM